MLDLKTHINNLLTFDHSELDDMLNQLFKAFETQDVEQVYRWLDLFWARLAMHIRAEHLHLFPAMLQAADSYKKKSSVPSFETLKDTITNLQADHNFFMLEILSAIKQMRDLRKRDQNDRSKELKNVREKIIAVKNRLEKHNKLEETQIYRWADTLLQPSERLELNGKMQKELANLPPRFGKSHY